MVYYDFYSEDWKEWCDYVVRLYCVVFSEELNLIGYFYSDCLIWVYECFVNEWCGFIFDFE